MKEKILGEVKGVYNRITLIEFFVSFIWVIIGIILVSSPEGSNTFFSIMTGIIFLLTGFSSIYSFIKRGTISMFNLNIIFGLIMIIIGILTLLINNSLQIFLGIYFLLLGSQKSLYGYILKKFAESSWLITFVVGLLFIVMGTISFFSENIIAVCGIFLIGYGLINMISVVLLRKRSKYYIA